MVDNAIQTLSQGWNGMSEDEREKFVRFYDPGNTGELDDKFVQSVQGNFERIGSRLQSGLDIKFTATSEMCQGMRLFYTDFLRVYVCPFMETETREARVARDLVHEVAHMALLSVDRAYYYEKLHGLSGADPSRTLGHAAASYRSSAARDRPSRYRIPSRCLLAFRSRPAGDGSLSQQSDN